ncbi:hypothetical protein BGX38DRAFT_376242 [Terfezia claveryi]|nr:hypothetical protein BGX38DRAFT_376242 [Terfezia claveryi]
MAKEGGAPITINWSDAEKVSLLLEVIKHKNVVPDWKSIKVPQGRTLTSAQSEYLKLTSTFPIRPPVAKVDEDEEMEDASDSAISAPAAKKQRRDSYSEEASSTSGVDGAVSSNASENGTVPMKSVAAHSTTNAQLNPLLPVKRKRGRPTKAESEARKAAQLRGEVLPPKPPSYTPVATPVYTVGPDGVQRRRRGRPSKAEVAARKAAEAEAAGAVPAAAALAPPVTAAAPAPPYAVKSDAS